VGQYGEKHLGQLRLKRVGQFGVKFQLNLIASIDPKNRSRNLKKLRELLLAIMKRWLDIKPMGSD